MKYSPDSVLENNMIHYVDSHAHIMGEEFQADFNEVIRRTEEAYVDQIMIITLSYEETMRAIEFASKDPEKYKVAAGIFPEDVEKVTDAQFEQFIKTASLPSVSVIGEIGLEFHWVKDEGLRREQENYFIKQIELAKALNKPIAVHSRDAMQRTFDIMKEHRCHGLMHCFSGTREMAREFVKLGYYIAFGGALTFKHARHAVEVTEDIDERYLLTETDCPYMAPEPVRGTRNEPSNIPYILKKMADIRNVSVDYMADVVYQNWQRYLEMK